MNRLVIVLLLASRLCAEDPIGRPADDPRAGEAPITMTVVEEEGTLGRLYLPIDIAGERRFAIVDCGTARFWIASPQEEGPRRGRSASGPPARSDASLCRLCALGLYDEVCGVPPPAPSASHIWKCTFLRQLAIVS